jgi:hypothetical protein
MVEGQRRMMLSLSFLRRPPCSKTLGEGKQSCLFVRSGRPLGRCTKNRWQSSFLEAISHGVDHGVEDLLLRALVSLLPTSSYQYSGTKPYRYRVPGVCAGFLPWNILEFSFQFLLLVSILSTKRIPNLNTSTFLSSTE